MTDIPHRHPFSPPIFLTPLPPSLWLPFPDLPLLPSGALLQRRRRKYYYWRERKRRKKRAKTTNETQKKSAKIKMDDDAYIFAYVGMCVWERVCAYFCVKYQIQTKKTCVNVKKSQKILFNWYCTSGSCFLKIKNRDDNMNN